MPRVSDTVYFERSKDRVLPGHAVSLRAVKALSSARSAHIDHIRIKAESLKIQSPVTLYAHYTRTSEALDLEDMDWVDQSLQQEWLRPSTVTASFYPDGEMNDDFLYEHIEGLLYKV